MIIRSIKLFTLVGTLIGFLTACGGESSAVVSLPNTNTGTGNGGIPSYSGPAPASDDVQRFKLNLWDNLAADNRCGTCHIQDEQAPDFVRTDDINLAYSAANSVVNLTNPIESIMVEKNEEQECCQDPNCCTSEEFKVKGKELADKVKGLIKEGNVRKITIKDKKGNILLAIPLTLGVIGAILAPIIAAVGAVAALVTECTISVQRKGQKNNKKKGK